jgi:hypothetical protein
MLMEVLDGNGNPLTISVQTQQPTTDYSNTLVADQVEQQIVPPNPNRAGLLFQNKGNAPMYISDVSNAGAGDPASFIVQPNQYWPPPCYPIPITAITVAGSIGQAFVYREW